MSGRGGALAALGVVILGGACGETVETRVLHRSSCEVCHQPLDEAGEPHGIEEAHPWATLSCTDCHGGHAYVCSGRIDGATSPPTCDGEWRYEEELAHPSPAGSPRDLRGLSPGQLDDVDAAWLRFVNPGDLRVVSQTCGRCHTAETAAVKRSAHSHAAGELAVARYRAGLQSTPNARVGAVAAIDPNAAQGAPCGAQAIRLFDPLPVVVGSEDALTWPSVATALDQVLAKECIGCHIQDFGPNDGPGRYRSSGCSACHSGYAEDGLARGGDPWVPRDAPPHPIQHGLTPAAPSSTCLSCHAAAGARIGLNYQGLREASAGAVGPRAVLVDRPLYGEPAGSFVSDEDGANDFDETPADVHFEAGMDCVDCHGAAELHGDGHIYADAACEVRTRCEDCHGTVRVAARPTGRLPGLFVGDDGALMLKTRVGGKTLRVPQVLAAVTPGDARFSAAAAAAMGVDGRGFSHTDELACTTCHAGWIPSCYGCHLTVDLARAAPYLTTGVPQPGVLTSASTTGFQPNDLVLVRDTAGKLALSMPSERVFMTLLAYDPGAEASRPLFSRVPRTFPAADGAVAGFGQRAIDPHTTRRRSQFQTCDRCHSAGSAAAPTNEALLDVAHGFGSERFDVRACAVSDEGARTSCEADETYHLDAVMTRDGAPLVVMGHPYPSPSRPLTLEEIGAMRAIEVEAATPVPPDARTNAAWPAARKVE